MTLSEALRKAGLNKVLRTRDGKKEIAYYKEYDVHSLNYDSLTRNDWEIETIKHKEVFIADFMNKSGRYENCYPGFSSDKDYDRWFLLKSKKNLKITVEWEE